MLEMTFLALINANMHITNATLILLLLSDMTCALCGVNVCDDVIKDDNLPAANVS